MKLRSQRLVILVAVLCLFLMSTPIFAKDSTGDKSNPSNFSKIVQETQKEKNCVGCSI
jgi:hypothetical protein